MAGRIRKAYNLQCEAATNKREQQGQGVGCQESSFFANKDSRLSFFWRESLSKGEPTLRDPPEFDIGRAAYVVNEGVGMEETPPAAAWLA